MTSCIQHGNSWYRPAVAVASQTSIVQDNVIRLRSVTIYQQGKRVFKPVKHTRHWCGTGKYTDGQVDNTHERGEYVADQKFRSSDRDEEVSNSSDPVEMASTKSLQLAPNGVGPRMNISSGDRDAHFCEVESTQSLQYIYIYIYTYTAGYGRTMISARDTRLKIVRITRARTIRNIQYTRIYIYIPIRPRMAEP